MNPASPQHQFAQFVPLGAQDKVPSSTSSSPVRRAKADRRERFPELIRMPADGHQTLDALKVCVVGCGAIGRMVATDLARLSIGGLYLVDPKSYKPQSLLTQQISPDQVGLVKAESTAKACAELCGPETKVSYHAGKFQELDLTALLGADVIVMATDNLNVEQAVGQWAAHFGKPLIHAAVHGETLVAQVSCYGNQRAETPCPCCNWGPAEWEHFHRETTFACDAGNAQPTIAEVPTTSVASLCGLAANLATLTLLRLVLRLGQSVDDTAVQFCAYTNESVTGRIKFKPTCTTNHLRFVQRPMPKSKSASLAILAEKSGFFGKERDPATFELGGLNWVESALCHCQEPRSVGRFFADSNAQPLPACESCGQPLNAPPIFTHRRVSAFQLGAAIDQPLSEICGSAPPWVVVRNCENAVIFLNPKND